MAGYGRIMTAEELNKAREANYNPGFLQNIADTAVSELSGLAESGLRGASNFLGGVEGLEEGADWFKQKQYDRRNSGIRQEWLDQGISAVLNPEFWTDPRGATAVGTSFITQSLPFMAVGGGAGLLAKSAGLGLKGALATSAGTMGAFDAFSNTAEGIEELRKQGLSESEIRDRRLNAMKTELPIDIIAGLPMSWLLLGRGFGKGIKGAITGGGIEFGTEWLQEMFQNINNEAWLKDKPYRLPTEQEVKQTALQTSPAFLMGGFGNLASNNDETQTQAQPQIQPESEPEKPKKNTDFSDLETSRPDMARVYDYLRSRGASPTTALGLVASMDLESAGGQADIVNEIGARGLFQFYADRREAYERWCEENGRDPDSAKSQIDFVLEEDVKNQTWAAQQPTTLYDENVGAIPDLTFDTLNQIEDPVEVAKHWEFQFERPGSEASAQFLRDRVEQYRYLLDRENTNSNSTYDQPTQFNNEQKADNRPQIQYEESRPLFNLQDLLKDENVESGLAEDIIEDYYRSVNQDESNPTRKRLAREMLNEQGEFNVNRENIRKIIEQDSEGLSQFVEENADTYFPRPTRPKSEIYEDMQGTAEDLKTAVDRKHYPSYKQAANRMKELQSEWNPKYVGRRHRQPNEPENAVTKQERNQLLRDAYEQKLAAEFNGDKQALKEINARIKEIENLPIIENHARNYPRIKTEQEEMDEEAKKILDDFNRIRNEEKLDDKEDRPRVKTTEIQPDEEDELEEYPEMPRDPSARLTVPEVIKRAGLENQHPTDAGSLHVETLPQDDDSDLTTVKLNGNINKTRGKTSNTISNLAKMAKELGGSYNSRNRTFNFKDPEDADTFSEASQQYLDNGYQSLKPEKVKPEQVQDEESEPVEEESTPEDVDNLNQSLNNAKNFISEQRKQSKDDPNVNEVLDHMENLLDNPEAVDRNKPKQAQQDIQSLMKEAGDLIDRIGRDNYINEVERPQNPKDSSSLYTRDNGYNFDVVGRESAREILKKLGLSQHPADAGTLHVEIDEENPRLARIEGKRDSKARKEEAKPGLNKIARYIGGEYNPKIHAFEFLDPADTKQFRDVGYYYLDNEEIDETSPRIIDPEEEKRQLVRDWIDKTTKKFTGKEIRKYSPENISKMEGEPQKFENLPSINEKKENPDAGIVLDMKPPRIMDKFKGTATRKKRIPDVSPESTPENWIEATKKADEESDNEPAEKTSESEEVDENEDIQESSKPSDDIETIQDSRNEEEADSDDVKNEMQKKLDEADLTDSERKDLQNLLEKISSNKNLKPAVQISSFEHQLKKVLKKKKSDKPVETSNSDENVDESKSSDGKDITLFSDNNKKYNAKYKVVSAKDLITSHELNGSSYITNKNYPQELQPRDRERATMQTEVSSMAGDIIPEQITSSLNLNQGAPVVRSDGVVLNGNGRTLALITAYKRNLADNYKKYLIEHSDEFGIDKADIEKINQPILVREITDELTDEEIQDVINSTTGGSRLGSSEKAVNDSKKLKFTDLQGYEENETGDLTTADNSFFVWNIANKIIPAKEMNEYTTKIGELNADGYQRVKRALFSVAYEDPGLIEKMAQSTDDIIKNVSNALMYAAPQIAHTQLSINEGHSENYPLSETISAAVKLYENAKREEIPIALVVRRNESAIFDKESDETMKILEIMEQNKRKSRQLGQFFSTIAKYIEEQGDPNQSSLFGDDSAPKLSFQEILDASYKTVFERNLQTNQTEINAERVHNATAKNKQMADLAKQLGAVKMAGKLTFTNPAMEQKFLEVLDSPYGVNIAYHGSGADFDSFSLDKIGSGEGEQGYGWGFYFAKEEDTARWYRDRLESRLGFEKEREVIVNNERYHESYKNGRTVWIDIDTGEEVTDDDFNRALTIKSNNEDPQFNPDKKDLINLAKERYKDNPKLVKLLEESKKWTATTLHNGKMFQLNLPSVKFLLDEQKSFDKQSKFVQDVLRELDKQNPKYFEGFLEKRSGKSLYEGISRIEGSPKKASEKLLSQGIEGLAYDGGANGKCFVIFDPKAIQILRKYSMKRDKLGKQIQNLKILAPEDLSDRQKAIQEMGQRLGVPVVYFEGNRNLHGFQSGGISFLNKNSATSIEWTFWHEFFHALKAKNNNFYNQILNEIKKTNPFNAEQIQKYREEIGAFELSDEDIIEEMLADNMSRSARRAGIIDSLRGKRNLFQRLMDYIKDTFNRVKDFFETPRNGLNQNQRDIMDREIKKLADSIQKLDNSKPKNGKFEVKFSNPEQIVEVTGREFGDYTDIKDLRKKAIQYYRDNLQGTSVVNEELGKIDFDHNSIVEFTGAGRDKVKATSAQETKLLLIPYLPQLIETADRFTYEESYKDKHNGESFYRTKTQATIQGKPTTVHIVLIKRNNGQIVFYNHNVGEYAGKAKGEPVNSAAPVSSQSEALGSLPVGSSLNGILADDSGNVKFSRKQDLSDEERINSAVKKSSKLQKLAEQLGATEVNGNIRFSNPDTAKKFLGVLDSEYGINIAYHGSGADFDSFDLSKIGSGEGTQAHGYGLYFAQNEKISQSYKRLIEKLTGGFEHYEITTQDGAVYVADSDPDGVWTDWKAKDSPQINAESESLKYALHIRLDAELEVRHGSISKAEDYINEQIQEFKDFNPFSNPYNKPNYAEQEHAKLLKLLKESKKWTVDIEESEGPKGRMYQLNLPAKKYMLDEQKSFDEQSKHVKEILQRIDKANPEYFKGRLDSLHGRSIYKAISNFEESDRKASEILLQNGIQGITYVGRRDGRCFVAFDPQLIQILRKYSKKKGSLLQNQEFLSKTDLTSSQKKLQEFGKSLGVPTVFFKGDKNLNGYYTGGISFLNTESGRSLEWTFWHESFHWMKSHNPKLYNQMIEGIKKAQPFSKEQLDAYREKVGLSTLSDDDVLEEMLADTMPEAADRLRLMDSINPSLTERLVSWLKETLNKFVEFFHNPAGKLTTKQRDAMIKSFNEFATQLTDSAGNQIFNLNPKTRQLEVNKNKTNSVAQVTSTEVKYSINAPVDRFNRAAQKLASKLGMKPSTDRITVQNPERNTDEFGILKYVASSPSRIKNRAFQFYYEAGRNANQKLVRLRNNYSRKLAEAIEPITSEQKSELYELLWQGDAEGKEFGKLSSAEKSGKTVPEMDQIRAEKVANETGVDKQTAEAYVKIRRLMNAVYHQLDSAKRKPKVKTVSLDSIGYDLGELERNKFIEIVNLTDQAVTYKEYPHWQRVVDGVPNQAVEQMKKDPDIQITKVKDNEDGTSRVEWVEGYSGLNRREGYIPHLFHEWRVRIRKQDENGNWHNVTEGNGSYGGMIDSGRTQREALKNAEDWLKSNQLKDGEQIFIEPAPMNFENLGQNESDDDMKYRESDYAPIMGDKDFHIMQSNIAHNQGMTMKDVKAMLDGSVRQINRRRFFGNFLKRNGSKGFEEDLDFVLRHYLNSSARYIAMDEFKSKTISQFERQFGSFKDDYVGKNSLADYVKDYIRDVNGNPPTLENVFNNALNSSTVFQKFIGSSFGDRAALSAVNALTHRIGYLTLGMGNVSSALLNLSQLINAYGYLGEGTNLIKYVAKYSKPNSKFDSHDLRILTRCGTLEDMGLDANSGYDKNRGMVSHLPILNQIDKVGNFSMKPFQKADAIARIATTLTAYDKAIKEGKTERDAIKYARDMCRDANFDYSQADAPNIFRRGSIISQLGLQFKKYGLKELEVMYDFIFGNTDAKQKLRFWGTYFLMVGLMGIPTWDFLDWLFKEFLNVGSPKDFLQRSIMEVCGGSKEGKALGKIAMYGIGSTLNANISTRVGMQDVFPTQPSNLAGPAASKIYNLVHDLRHNGLGLQAIRDVSPGLYNILAATYGEAPGNRNRLNSKYEDVYSKVLRGMGFKSIDETIESDIQRIVYNTREKLTEEKQTAIDEYLDNPTAENARKLRQLKIKPETVKEERKRKRQTRLKRTKDSLTKQERKMNREMFRFAR